MQKYPNVRVCFADKYINKRYDREYLNLIELVQGLGYNRCQINCKNRLYDGLLSGWIHYNDFVVYDQHGKIIHSSIVQAVAENHAGSYQYAYHRRKNFVFRQGPVEGTGNYRWGARRRGMKVAQEIRENEFLQYDEDACEHNIKERVKRNKQYLPQWYDDIYKSNIRDKNWKQYRKTQYK